MKPMDEHERWSELLPAYARGELDRGVSDELRGHIADCGDCAAELRAVEAFVAATPEPLTEIERTRMRREIRTATFTTQVEPARSVWGTRLVQVLGAAALITGVAFAGYMFTGMSGQDESSSAVGGADGRGTGGGQGTTMDAAAPESAQLRALPDPFFAARRKWSQDALIRLGRRNFPVAERTGLDVMGGAATQDGDGADSGPGEDRARDVADHLDHLVARAPEDLREQIETCARVTLESEPGALPVFAARGSYENRSADDHVVIGFAYGEQTDLNKYMFWVWPVGSCDVPVDYISGRIGS